MENKIKKARVIYNPTSGQEIIKKNIAEVLDVLRMSATKQVPIRPLQSPYQPN